MRSAAQLLEHGAVARVLVEEAGVELEQRAEGGVVEGELAVGGEDGDAGGEPVEHAAVGDDQPRHAGAHAFRLGAVDGDAGAAAAARRIDDVERAPLAGDDRRQPAAIAFAGGAGARHFLAAGAVEQFGFARHGIGRVGRLDRARIGGVDEDQPAAVVARPDRRGQRIEQRAHGFDVGQQSVVTGGEIDQFALDAADVAQPQHRAAADGAAFGFDRPAGGGGERHDEAAAVAAQVVDRVLHALRGGRLEPGAEGEHAIARRAGRDDAGVADDVGRVLGRRRQATSTCGSDSSSALSRSISALSDIASSRAAFSDALGAAARAQQHDGSEHGEADQAERQRQPGDILPALAARRTGRTRRRGPARSARSRMLRRRRWRGHRPAANAASRSPSGSSPAFRACPRMRASVRHAARESRRLYPRGDFAPKEFQTVNVAVHGDAAI